MSSIKIKVLQMYRELDLIQEHEDSLIVEEGIGPLVVMENTVVEKVDYCLYWILN